MAYNYSIISTSTILGLISKRYLYVTGIDKKINYNVIEFKYPVNKDK